MHKPQPWGVNEPHFPSIIARDHGHHFLSFRRSGRSSCRGSCVRIVYREHVRAENRVDDSRFTYLLIYEVNFGSRQLTLTFVTPVTATTSSSLFFGRARLSRCVQRPPSPSASSLGIGFVFLFGASEGMKADDTLNGRTVYDLRRYTSHRASDSRGTVSGTSREFAKPRPRVIHTCFVQ